MKILKILIISNLDHASPRIPGLSQYFIERGDDIRVVTPISSVNYMENWGLNELNPKKFQVINAPYNGDVLQILRKIFWFLGFKKEISLTEQLKSSSNSRAVKIKSKVIDFLLFKIQEFFGIPDIEISWYKSAYKTSIEEIKVDRPDVLISSSPYMTSHMVASKLSKKYDLKWVADFRDSWSNNPVYPFSSLRRKLDTFLERKIIFKANIISTVSTKYAEKLKEIHHQNPLVIPNGYTKLNNKDRKNDNNFLEIVYTGMIYDGYQNYPQFLNGIRDGLDNNLFSENDLRVNFYGRYLFNLQEKINEFNLDQVVFQNGLIPREDAFSVQANSDLQLFFNWEGDENGGLSHLKLYEYLGAMRPILVFGDRDDKNNQEIVKKTNTGYVCIGRKELANQIKELINLKKENKYISHSPNISALKENSYYERGRLLRSELIKILK